MASVKLMAALAFAGAAVQAQSAPLTQTDIDRLDANCASVETSNQAAMCLRLVYSASMNAARDIHAALSEQSKGDILPDSWKKQCLGADVPPYTSRVDVDVYLRRPSWCLNEAAQGADKAGVSYDVFSAEYLIARLRRLSRLDLR